MDLEQRVSSATLLDRVRDLRVPRAEQDTTPAAGPAVAVTQPAPPRIDPAAALRSLLREVQRSVHGGIATPSHLFTLLHRHLEVARGVLLVNDGELFVPIAHVGIDRTTERKCRIPHALLREMVPDNSVRFLYGTGRSILQQFLSQSDFRRSNDVALFPFVHLQRVLAVLVLFDAPILQREHEILGLLLTALNAAVAPLLFEAREKPRAHWARALVFTADQTRDAAQRTIAAAEERGTVPVAIQLSLEPIITAVQADHPHMGKDRLRIDLLRTISALLSHDALVVATADDGCIVFVVDGKRVESRLLVQITMQTLSGLFGLRAVPQIVTTEMAVDELTKPDPR